MVESEIINDQNKDYQLIRQAILKLSEEYQEVLNLRYFEKMQIKEIVDVLDKKEGTIKSLLSRGVDKLKIELEKIQTVVQPKVAAPVVIKEDAI